MSWIKHVVGRYNLILQSFKSFFQIPDGMTTLDSDDMEMEESVPPDPHAELRKQLEELVKDSQVFLSISN